MINSDYFLHCRRLSMSSYLSGSSSSSILEHGGEDEAGDGCGVQGEEESGGRITEDRSRHLRKNKGGA